MNTRLEGWRLALAILLPTLIIGAALWFAIQALTSNDNTSVDASALPTALPTVTSTPLAETTSVDEPTVVPTPTPIELPTAQPVAALPSSTPVATATAIPTAIPAQPSQPSQPSQPAPPSGPTPTPTVDPTLVTVSCTGATFPLTVAVDEALPVLSSSVTPAEKAATMQFQWTFGNGRVVGAPNSGTISYSTPGSYTITLQATDTTTSEVRTITCGTVTVGSATAAVRDVACRVRPVSSAIKWEDATLNDLMRVTTTWKPADAPLTLQYEFEINDPIIFSNGAVSGDSLDWSFVARTSVVGVFWRDEATGETGVIECPAFSSTAAPTATATAAAGTATPTPTGVAATVTPTPTGTAAAATATPTPTATTAAATATPTPTATTGAST